LKKYRIALCLLLVLFITACGNTTQSNQNAAGGNSSDSPEQEEYVLKLAHGYPTTSFMHTFMEWFNEELQQRSEGRLSIDIYPSGQLMPVDQEMPAILQGQIDMSHSSSPVLTSFDPIWNFYELPFIFDYDPKDPAVFLENRMAFSKSENGGQIISQMMEEKGLKILSFGFVDMFGSVYTTDLDNLVTGPESANGLKLRTPGGMIGPETAQAIGASSVTIAGAEVITALQQKTVDGLLTTPIYASQAKLPVKSFSVVPLFNSVTPLVMSLNKFESLPADLQEILVQTGEDLEKHIMESVLEEAQTAYTNLESQGVKIYYPTKDEIAEWEEATKPVREVFVNQVEGGAELLEALE
jgi:TRAP-type C4-dicarboxylate transport system substrate-binding protein